MQNSKAILKTIKKILHLFMLSAGFNAISVYVCTYTCVHSFCVGNVMVNHDVHRDSGMKRGTMGYVDGVYCILQKYSYIAKAEAWTVLKHFLFVFRCSILLDPLGMILRYCLLRCRLIAWHSWRGNPAPVYWIAPYLPLLLMCFPMLAFLLLISRCPS